MARQLSPSHSPCPARRPAASGFTLIEISIVLVIIGLIVGGALVGRSLIEIAKTRALIAQIDSYKAAVNAFRLKYNALPGDMSPDKAAGFGFAARAGVGGGGNEDGLIGKCPIESDQFDRNLGCERVLFWRDLSDANMVNGSFTVGGDGPAINLISADLPHYLPRAKGAINNGYVAALGNAKTDYSSGEPWTNYFVVIGITRTNALSQTTRTNVLSPQMAYIIDKKLDDGAPFTGSTRGWKVGNAIIDESFFFPVLPPVLPSLDDCFRVVDPSYRESAVYVLLPDTRDRPICVLGTLF